MDAPQSEEEEVEDPMDKVLKDGSYNLEDPGSYEGVKKLLRRAKKAPVHKVTRGRVKQVLADQESYSIHKPARLHLKRDPTYVNVINAQCKADLADM